MKKVVSIFTTLCVVIIMGMSIMFVSRCGEEKNIAHPHVIEFDVFKLELVDYGWSRYAFGTYGPEDTIDYRYFQVYINLTNTSEYTQEFLGNDNTLYEFEIMTEFDENGSASAWGANMYDDPILLNNYHELTSGETLKLMLVYEYVAPDKIENGEYHLVIRYGGRGQFMYF